MFSWFSKKNEILYKEGFTGHYKVVEYEHPLKERCGWIPYAEYLYEEGITEWKIINYGFLPVETLEEAKKVIQGHRDRYTDVTIKQEIEL